MVHESSAKRRKIQESAHVSKALELKVKAPGVAKRPGTSHGRQLGAPKRFDHLEELGVFVFSKDMTATGRLEQVKAWREKGGLSF